MTDGTEQTAQKPAKKKRKRRRKPLLRFTDTTKYHGEVLAVGPVTFDVPAGQLLALIGHNGSGKSTLLATAAGVLEPTDGRISVNGTPAGGPVARASISFIRDHPVLYEDLTVREHLEYLTRLHGSTPEAHGADRILEHLGLSGRVDDLPSTFSRGLRQKAAIAVALCRPFSVLLVDEPFSGLDQSGRLAFIDLIREIREQKASVIVATHDRAALDLFDRAVMLDAGEVVYDGDPSGVPAAERSGDR
jgi:ABC-type multidrug transport system ATPase subunit